MSEKITTSRIPLLWITIPFAFGIIASEQFLRLPLSLSLALSGTAAALSVYFSRKHTILWNASICTSLFLVGNLYYSHLRSANEVRQDFPSREAALEIRIKRIFTQNDLRTSGIATISHTDIHLEDFEGRSLFFSLRNNHPENKPQVGSHHQVVGQIKSLKNEDDSSFNDYLKTTGQWGSLTYGNFKKQTKGPNILYIVSLRARHWIKETLGHSLDPQASFHKAYQAIMLGEKKALSSNQRDIFLRSGTMHLFAISGLHIGIIATCFVALFKLFRLSNKAIPIATLFGIAAFVFVSGGGASAWRALLMISCYFLCQNLKLQRSAMNALSLSALICLLIDPRQIFQAGFQMSYSVVFAILLYGVPLAQKTKAFIQPFALIPRPLWQWHHTLIHKALHYIIDIVSISLAASTVSGLLTIKYFGAFPLIGILLSSFILPLASLAIIAGFCSLISNLAFVAPLSALFNHSAALLLLTIESLLQKITDIPNGAIQNIPKENLSLIAVTGILGIMLWAYAHSWKVSLRWLWTSPIALLGTIYLWVS
ncbi:ComEC/Rec2 family competence protein [Puniceicoccaceae bacterium K14]|nr:ComEC/Rec2 family competence protein [Puniceicoccaceae bacterium K14]